MDTDLGTPAGTGMETGSGFKAGPQEPPRFSFPLVRTGVLDTLIQDAELVAKLVTLVAPTGYGKTVLAAALFERLRAGGMQGYWIALDDRDRSTDRVLALLETELSRSTAQIHPTQALILGDAPIESRIAALIDVIARMPGPVVIVLDNLGYCTDETLSYLLDRLVFRTPSSLRLVFSSTHAIPMSLARAKLEGRVRELGYADLSLGPADIRELLGPSLCQQLGDEAVDAVARQTEGWPAAVRLAQIILQTAERPTEALAKFSGADEDLSDLLNQQVLAGFDADARQFLLAISPLRSFCAELCLHATGNQRAAEHLAVLLQRNVFVIPLDRTRSWYRLHGLFREYLIEQAQRNLDADTRRAILERAAEWCERQGHWQDAIDYALAAGSSALAIALLERVAPLFVRDRGDLRQYIGWIEQLLAEGQQPGWEAEFWYVWALVFHRRYDYARQRYERLARRIDQAPELDQEPSLRHAMQRRAQVIRICLDTYTDRLRDARIQGSAWLADRAADDPFDVATIASAVCISCCSEHQFLQAREVMRQAQSAIGQALSVYGTAWVSLLAAMVPVLEGNYAEVHHDLLASLARARAALGESAGIAGTIALVGAKCAVEMGLDEEARGLLTPGLRWANSHGIVDTAAVGLDAAIKLWSGRADDAISIAQLREIAAGYSPRLGLMLSCMLVSRLLRLGRLQDAQDEAAQIGLGRSGSESRGTMLEQLETARAREWYVAAEIDLLIATGHLKQAELLIAQETQAAKHDGRIARLVELALCETAIALCSHHPQVAARHLSRAVSYAAKRRIVRPFRDRAELIAGMVNETKPQSWAFALDEERQFFVELCRGLPLGNAARLDALDIVQGQAPLLDTPTARELELLSLIEAGMSNQQLADRLSVSVATVKWHLYNLYTKLGVSSRSAALARARSLNLLTR